MEYRMSLKQRVRYLEDELKRANSYREHLERCLTAVAVDNAEQKRLIQTLEESRSELMDALKRHVKGLVW